MLNPNLRVVPVLTDGRVTAYSLVALVRGRGRLQNTVEVAGAGPDVADVLQGLVDADADVEVEEDACARLVELGVLVRTEEVSRRVAFSCRLEVAAPFDARALTVNPEFAIVAYDDFIRREPELGHVLEPCEQLAVVTDPVTGARCPYWIDDRDHALLRRLVPGAPPPAEIDFSQLGRYTAAGIFIDPAAVACARQRVDAATAHFARYRYAELPAMLPVPQIAALRSYYGRLLEEGRVSQHDRQVPRRHAQHNERVMQYYHRQLSGLFARVIGEQLKPSYGYFASYRRGATLEKHRDRAQCKFTASLLLEHRASPSDDRVWPLYLELPETREQVAVGLQPGGCLLFSGCEQPHYRHEFRGDCYMSFFLHYVDEAFTGRLE